MGTHFLADSNVLIDLMLGRLPAVSASWLERLLATRQVAISVVSRIELLTKTEPAAEYVLMQALVSELSVLALDEPVILQTIRLRQQHRIKLPDAIIAASALVHGLLLLSRNTNDFQAVAGLRLLNPHEPDELPELAD